MDLSIIIPLYNEAESLPELKAWIDKALKDFTYELIFVDDGSTDSKTLDYLQTLHQPTIRIIHQENKGLGGARNTGIQHATGDYIGFLDADDWLPPTIMKC